MRPFWLEQALATDPDTAPPLIGPQQADVCIIGGGYTGLWTAIQLKQEQPDLDVLLIERDLCGAGASGRNGGCLLTWSTRFFTLQRLFGDAEAVRLVKASEAAVDHIADFCRRHAIDAEVRIDGTLYTATAAAQLGALDPVLAALSAHGVCSFQPLPADEVRRRAGSARHLAGVYSPAAGSVQPGKLVRGLRRVAREMGVRLFEQTPMLDLAPGNPARIRTPQGEVRAGRVVLALNAWMASHFPAFERSITVVSSDMVITEPRPDLLAAMGLTDGVAVLDSRTFVYYYRRTPDGRLMLGKGGNTFAWRNRILPVFDQPSPYLPMLKRSLAEFFPSLADVPIAASWNGPSDRSLTGLPFFGRYQGQANVFYGFGYSGNGVGPSYLGGQILASLVLGQDNAWTRSGLVRGPLGSFPPEPIRHLGALLVRNAIRRKEQAEDAGRKPTLLDDRLARFAAAAGKADAH